MLKLFKKIDFVFILIIAIYILLDFNLKLPTKIIRRRYLISTPIKSNMLYVKRYLKRNNYDGIYISRFGYRTNIYNARKGSYYIKANIGDYRWIFVTDVLVIWIFDENQELIEIIVEKETDAL